MQISTTKKLYKGKYQYNIVLVSAFAFSFRGNNLKAVEQKLAVEVWANKKLHHLSQYPHVKNAMEVKYAKNLLKLLRTMDDYAIRVETPTITVYTNDYKKIIALRDLNNSKVRKISVPKIDLEKDTIYMPEIDYEYRVTISKTTQQYLDFLEWADSIDKLRITNSCREMLSQYSSYGGTCFYVNGENMLLMCRMQLAGTNLTVHRIVR